jgi:hypothetical protein
VTITAVTGSVDGSGSYAMISALQAADFVSDGDDYWVV